MSGSPVEVVCHRCGGVLRPGSGDFYVVRIEAFADPTPPVIEGPIEDAAGEIAALIESMDDLSERELMDQVHRRLSVTLCRRCYTDWIEDPTG